MDIETTKKLKLTYDEFSTLDKARDIMYDIWLDFDENDRIGNFGDYNFKEIYDFLDKFVALGKEDDDSGIVTFEIH